MNNNQRPGHPLAKPGPEQRHVAPQGASGEPGHPFKTGYDFQPTEVVTERKLGDQVDEMKVDYPALAQILANSGTPTPDALLRFRHNRLELRNATTGKWHALWLGGNSGEETIHIGPGVD